MADAMLLPRLSTMCFWLSKSYFGGYIFMNLLLYFQSNSSQLDNVILPLAGQTYYISCLSKETEITSRALQQQQTQPIKEMRLRFPLSPNEPQNRRKQLKQSSFVQNKRWCEFLESKKNETGGLVGILGIKILDHCVCTYIFIMSSNQTQPHETTTVEFNDINQQKTGGEGSKTQTHSSSSEKVKRKRIAAVIVVMILVVVGAILGVYLSRKPEIVSVSESVLTKYESKMEQIQRYFFNISGITYTGRKNQGRGAASIYRVYSPVIDDFLQEMPEVSPYDSENDNSEPYKDYGYIDIFAEAQGVTVRALNPINRIYYVDYQTMLEFASKAQTSASRLLTAHQSARILAATTQDSFAEVLAQEVAELEGVALDRIVVAKEEVWVGTLNSNGDYTISTEAVQVTTVENSSQTEEQKKEAAQALYDRILKVAIEEKKSQLEDYGAVIADYFKFSFDRYVDLYITYQKAISFRGDSDDEEVQEFVAGTNATNSTKIIHPAPIIFTKIYEAVYGSQPARLKEAKTISRETYEQILACIDYNETTRVCEVDEWLDVGSANKISEASMSNQGRFASRTRFKVSVKPLPADQVIQEPYYPFDPLQMYKSNSDADQNSQMSYLIENNSISDLSQTANGQNIDS